MVGSCTSHPGVLGSIPKREEPGKIGRHPVLKYRVPHGSQCAMTGQTSSHRPRLVVSRSTCPPLSPSPHANSFRIGTAVINTHSAVCEPYHSREYIPRGKAGESNRADRRRRRLYFYSRSAISRPAAHLETVETPLLLWQREISPPPHANSDTALYQTRSVPAVINTHIEMLHPRTAL